MSRPFVAPCCHCYQLRLFPHEENQAFMDVLPKGSAGFARWRTKKNLGETTYHMLSSFGYTMLFPNDPRRPIYSCDKCYTEFGSAMPEIWEYNQRGFMRS